jgi:hypothetical protein
MKVLLYDQIQQSQMIPLLYWWDTIQKTYKDRTEFSNYLNILHEYMINNMFEEEHI